MATDFLGLGALAKPLVKLIEVAASGMGAIARPWMIRRDARATADRLLIMGHARRQLAEPGLLNAPADGLPQLSAAEQPTELAQYIEAGADSYVQRTMENLQEVLNHARNALPDDVSADPVDPEWTARFFTEAQHVSRDDMRRLWGRILANEVSRPGSFSPRTLTKLKDLTSQEANLFQDMMLFVCDAGPVKILPVCQLIYGRFKELRDAGLLGDDLQWRLESPDAQHVWRHANVEIVISSLPEHDYAPFPLGYTFSAAVLSRAGAELSCLAPVANPSADLVKSLVEMWGELFQISIRDKEGEVPALEWISSRS